MTNAAARNGHGGVTSAVAADSLAQDLGLEVGDEVLSVSGQPVRDVIDVRYHGSVQPLQLEVRRSGETYLFEAEGECDKPLGLTFVTPIFNRVNRCDNRCEFCFVAQMPQGLRPSLYIKDDDYRTSFLFGSYVTLTNLTEADWRRIGDQRLSPLYVSVHATDLDLRRRLLGNPEAPDVLAQLRRLAAMDIVVHTQIVVRPGVNDGSVLDRAIADLVALHPAIRSVSIVPVGLTRYHRYACRLHTEAEVSDILKQVTGWQVRFRDSLGVAFTYLSDEWYLRMGEAVPPTEHYDGLDLTENGVGLVRHFLDEERERLVALISELESATLVTGVLFAPTLRAAVAGARADVVSVINRFFGESVSVAGLVTAQDVIDQLKGRDLGEALVLPPSMFAGPEGQTLDGMWPTDLRDALGLPALVGVA